MKEKDYNRLEEILDAILFGILLAAIFFLGYLFLELIAML